MAIVEFYFDFGSPNAYLAHKVIPQMEARTGARFAYLPILLGGVFKLTGNQSPMTAFGHIRNKLAYEAMDTRRFIQRHGLDAFRQNPHFPVNTLLIMRGAVAARELGVFEAYVASVFAEMWERGLKMDDPVVVAESLTAAGLPAEAILALAGDGAIKARLVADTEAAVEAGVFGSPSFRLGEDLWFGKERLRDVEDALLAAGT